VVFSQWTTITHCRRSDKCCGQEADGVCQGRAAPKGSLDTRRRFLRIDRRSDGGCADVTVTRVHVANVHVGLRSDLLPELGLLLTVDTTAYSSNTLVADNIETEA
jgi:hypothetical protein